MQSVDLQQLAIDREPARPLRRARKHLLTRYVLPLGLLAGFASLTAWSAWDLAFPPTPVKVVPVIVSRTQTSREGAPLFKAAGWIEPRPTAIRVAALAPGVVERLLVVEDQAVAAGDVIAELVKDDARLNHERAIADSKLREAEVAEATAALVSAQTRLDQPVHLKALLSEAEAALAQVETQLKNLPHETRRAEAQVKFAQQNYGAKNAASGAVSGLSIAKAQSEVDTAESLLAELNERADSLQRERLALVARRDAQQTQLALLADEIKTRDEAKARADAAAARLEQARVAVEQAELQLSRMTIRAPVNGRVFRLVAQPGAALSGEAAGGAEGYDGSTVVTLYQPEQLQVRVDVRFEDIPQVSAAQPVQIENPGLKTPLTGHVLFISSFVNIQKNTLEVKVAMDTPPSLLKPEMLVNATFCAPPTAQDANVEDEQSHVYLPQRHVHQDEAGSFVWIADQSDEIARRTPVTAGATLPGGLVEIESGLTVSSWVISSGVEQLEDGKRIRVTGEDDLGIAAPAGDPTEPSAPHPAEGTH